MSEEEARNRGYIIDESGSAPALPSTDNRADDLDESGPDGGTSPWSDEDRGLADEGESVARELDPEHMKALHSKIDGNSDGKMTSAEILAFWKQTRHKMVLSSIDLQMEMMDNDKDNKISMDELLGVYSDRFDDESEDAEMLREKQAHELEVSKFQVADANQDGFLDKQELPAAIHPEANPEVLRLIAKHALEFKDKNGDGKLDAAEFWETEANEHDGQMLSDFRKLDLDASGFLDLQEIEEWETGTFHTASAMEELFQITGIDKDAGITVEEFHEHLDKLKETEAGAHFADWAAHHEHGEL